MATLLAVCSSERKDLPKEPVQKAFFVEDHGIQGDAHAGSGLRQVSLLRMEDIEEAEKEAGFSFPFGSLAENLVISGLPSEIEKGSLIYLGDQVVLEFVEKGKKPGEPHSYDYRGWCLLPDKGYFLRVIKGGEVFPPEDALF